MRICLLSCHNQYASKRYFTQKLAEAMIRKGIDTHIFAWDHGPFPDKLIDTIKSVQPDLTASFHQLPEQPQGGYFWDHLQLPHWTILLDPAFYDLELMQSPYSLISCVDRNDCQLLNSYHFERTFFFPHAVERELVVPPRSDKPIDVILLGTCYDPDNLYSYWQKHYSPQMIEVLEEASKKVLSDDKTTFFRALLQTITSQGIDPRDVEFDKMANHVDSYTRGVDRLNLVRSIKDAHVHVYGGSCWREEKPIADWTHYLSKQKNVTVHPPVSFSEALDLLKQSKICLNSMPFFKDGTHERIFAAIACGAVPLTSSNQFLKEVFSDNEVMFYSSTDLKSINDRVNALLDDPKEQLQMIAQGQTIVKINHTWDNRVDAFLEILKEV